MKYLLINVISSTLFVTAIAYLYSITGTLNLAHLSERVAASGQDGLITTVSLLFLIVFSIKSALFLYFWLPESYSASPPAVSAWFAALLTKVGVYALIRMFTLVFYHQPQITHTILIGMASATMILGVIGAISSWDIRKILAYNVIAAVGFVIFGLGVATPASLTGAVFYLLHDMVAKALLFILGGAIIGMTGTSQLKEFTGLIRHHPLLGWLFFLTVLAIAGIPPLGGFPGKALLLQGGLERGFFWVVGVSLVSSLLVLYSLIKIFLYGFWGETRLHEEERKGTERGILISCSGLAALILVMGLGADWVLMYLEPVVRVLLNPDLYIAAVLQ